MNRGTSPAHVRRVLAIKDRVLRNYWITQTYADLSTQIAKLLEPRTANWCTFATWASYTVGRNLRGDELPKWLHTRIILDDGMMGLLRDATDQIEPSHTSLHGRMAEHVLDVVRELFGECATNLSDGNTEVFSEIAPPAAAFIDAYKAPDAEKASARASVLRLCEGAAEFEGMNRLRAGFSLWCDAMAEEKPMIRSQLILAGSLELGAHEQSHLQGAIAGSMDMGVNQSVERLKARLTQEGPSRAILDRIVSASFGPFSRAIGDLWDDVMTELLGTIETPDGVLRLNHDVPLVPGQPFIPTDLTPVVVVELSRPLARFDRSSPNGRHSRAVNWVDLNDRMNFITNLFRSRHHRRTFFSPPFGQDVLAELRSGRVPGHAESLAVGADATSGAALAPTPPGSHSEASSAAPTSSQAPATGDAAPSVGTTQFTSAFLEELRSCGDDPADAAVTAFFTATDARHSELFRRLRQSTTFDPSDDQLPGVATFVTESESWPPWADAGLVRRGQKVFGDWGPQLGMGLWMSSLPADYACAKGAEPLARTARLTTNPRRRYLETGQMIIDAMTPGALEPGERGYQTVRHVRLMHAAVRHVLRHPVEADAEGAVGVEPWDAASLGVPINQEDLLGCLFSFSVEGIEALKRSGVRLRAKDAEGYIHAWNLVGHQIGIRSDLLPLDWADSRELWDRIRERQYGQSEAGQELTAAAISCMQHLLGIKLLNGLPATGIRHYLGDKTADLLGVPKADWTRAFFVFVRVTDSVFDRTLARIPGSGTIVAMLGRRMLRGFEQCERPGDNRPPTFEIADELKQAWGMSRS